MTKKHNIVPLDYHTKSFKRRRKSKDKKYRNYKEYGCKRRKGRVTGIKEMIPTVWAVLCRTTPQIMTI